MYVNDFNFIYKMCRGIYYYCYCYIIMKSIDYVSNKQCLHNYQIKKKETRNKSNKAEINKKQRHQDYFYFLFSIYSNYSSSILLENKGNTARDHLANERTYLAWFRTSLTLITFSIGMIQLYHNNNSSNQKFIKTLGLISMLFSILFLYFGYVRYFHVQWALQQGAFPASRGIIVLSSFCILFIFISILTIMLLN
ncbi:uncharacterized protein BX663DRAFT_506834 [Cokeromyces recurvatus]|uniref:uncharacterized protein n=1 Tax=Cokeromyces recurvatus TaxID=90255 RepID=UPI00221FA702|nr:uncharacterized protein BX663DRAFT_506834 [Cokeromyces recurvatus]KAI7903546.1 hypothetical protein BX663DRAFT_506834 [Cokeromyces recurvatus]